MIAASTTGIFLLEDNAEQRQHYQDTIEKYLMIQVQYNMHFVLATAEADALLDYLDRHRASLHQPIFFLDIELNGQQRQGLEVGLKIRETMPDAQIVFITTHSELAPLTFEYQVGALDYIVKHSDEAQTDQAIRKVLDTIQRRFEIAAQGDVRNFVYKMGPKLVQIPLTDVMFLETGQPATGDVILHKRQGRAEFRGLLKDYQSRYATLFRAHKRYLVNPERIVDLDQKQRRITFENGETCTIATRNLSKLNNLLW
ncbi:response regulator transcription factor [Agrilactobacillus composti]